MRSSFPFRNCAVSPDPSCSLVAAMYASTTFLRQKALSARKHILEFWRKQHEKLEHAESEYADIELVTNEVPPHSILGTLNRQGNLHLQSLRNAPGCSKARHKAAKGSSGVSHSAASVSAAVAVPLGRLASLQNCKHTMHKSAQHARPAKAAFSCQTRVQAKPGKSLRVGDIYTRAALWTPYLARPAG
ncbi:hypothetical protein WJX82_011143 [Trebouxia sp. C0006]